ncbi:MAG: aminoglycoside phosphotransferase family protein [bacterium]|nr:aminoglycoside phosphotransferase family protein [bacterium]
MKKIADGNTAEIFEWADNRVCKLWRPNFPTEDVDYEARVSHIIASSQLPVPKVYDVIEYEGRRGIIYERITGITLFEWIFADLSRFEDGARWLGRLHATIHQHPALDGLPNQRDRLRRHITHTTHLNASERAILLTKLDAMLDDSVVCHGDFHPQNVLVADEKATIIDWMDATLGSGYADIARTLLLIDGAEAPPEFLELFKSAYLDEYARHRPLDREMVMRWYPIIAGARLIEHTSSQEITRLLGIVRDSL